MIKGVCSRIKLLLDPSVCEVCECADGSCGVCVFVPLDVSECEYREYLGGLLARYDVELERLET